MTINYQIRLAITNNQCKIKMATLSRDTNGDVTLGSARSVKGR